MSTPTLEEELALSTQELIAKHGNTSNAIRALATMGAKAGPIAKALDIRFQHARNVMSKPLKRQIKAEREALKAAKETQ